MNKKRLDYLLKLYHERHFSRHLHMLLHSIWGKFSNIPHITVEKWKHMKITQLLQDILWALKSLCSKSLTNVLIASSTKYNFSTFDFKTEIWPLTILPENCKFSFIQCYWEVPTERKNNKKKRKMIWCNDLCTLNLYHVSCKSVLCIILFNLCYNHMRRPRLGEIIFPCTHR